VSTADESARWANARDDRGRGGDVAMSSRADRALRVHPIVPCPVWYRQGMLEPAPGPAHDESASNRRTNIISCAAVTRQSRFHFEMVRVCIPPGHLHPRPPPTDLSCRGQVSDPVRISSSGRISAVDSRRVAETLSQTCESPTPTDPGPGNVTDHPVRAQMLPLKQTPFANLGASDCSLSCAGFPIETLREEKRP
jgi:hypothetical protein